MVHLRESAFFGQEDRKKGSNIKQKHLTGIRAVIEKLSLLGRSPEDDESLKLQKALLVLCAIPFVFAGLAWGVMYISFGEWRAGLIPMTYSVMASFSILHFAFSGNYPFFRFTQLALLLMLPFSLMVALGGFVNGSIVILWSVICPLGSLLFDKPIRAKWWFLAFVMLVIISWFLQPYVKIQNNLTNFEIIFFFVLNLVAVSSIVYFMISYFVGQKNIYLEQSDTLLKNMLPRHIAEKLRKDQASIADQYESASVLFVDAVNFTELSETMAPSELVQILNQVYSVFDLFAEEYGLEKIKTIGDCYMVASGVPTPRDDHAQALAAMAIDIRDYVEKHTFIGREIKFRMGMNSGPVVAGVIGKHKFAYDLWGDAVNTASRMESDGEEGKIQITRATYDLIKDDFICEPNGTINVKGKGDMEVWFVLDRKEV